MSFLSLSELNLSDQAAVMQSCAASFARKRRALITPFDSLAEKPRTPLAAVPRPVASESNPFQPVEYTPDVFKIANQTKPHPRSSDHQASKGGSEAHEAQAAATRKHVLIQGLQPSFSVEHAA